VKSAAPGSYITEWWKLFKERRFEKKPSVPGLFEEEKLPEPANVKESQLQQAIDPEKVIAWLITQPNAGGKLYLENVARQYMSALRSAPFKLEIPVALDNRGVFAFQTPDELATYWSVFKAAPNYMKVNIKTSGMFSAGMACLMRYLEHLPNEHPEIADEAIKAVEDFSLEYVDHRSSDGALWVIGGQELLPVMLKLRGSGFSFTYKAGGGKSSGYKDAWWYKPLVYSNQTKDTTPERAEASAVEPSESAFFKTASIELWNCGIGQSFQSWLVKHANYSYNTSVLYSGSIPRIVRDFRTLADKSVENASTQIIAVRRFVILLYEDSAFDAANRKGHHLYTAALAAFEKFIAWNGSQRHVTEAEQLPLFEMTNATSMREIQLDPALPEKLTQVLSKRFTNGFRVGSPIELARLRRYASEDLGDEISLTDDELMEAISACGTLFEGKVYTVSAQIKERIKTLANDYFSQGAKVIFYSEFYSKNENWLFDASVILEDMLKYILLSLFPKLSFAQTFFGFINASVSDVLKSEILRVWADDIQLTYEQLSARLQYIPVERIKCTLAQNGDFLWSSAETYSHISKVVITEEECAAIRKITQQGCSAHGYISIADMPLSEIQERNYELSITAIHNAIFRICLSDKYDKNDKIITRKGDTLDALTIMKGYCQTVDKCSLDDLLNYEKELTGEAHRWIALEAGYSVLVRIDKETFVAERYVHFHSDVIDDAIARHVTGDYLPLKSFTTFGDFPDCGQAWNLFLFESYCWRFSMRFRFDALSMNSRNAGAVIRKSCDTSYTDIMVDAAIRSDIPLEEACVGRFLSEAGYTGRTTSSKVCEIIEKAKAIREEMA